jgi:hypothetical protein
MIQVICIFYMPKKHVIYMFQWLFLFCRGWHIRLDKLFRTFCFGCNNVCWPVAGWSSGEDGSRFILLKYVHYKYMYFSESLLLFRPSFNVILCIYTFFYILIIAGLGLAYSIFSLVYYLCGGTDRRNEPIIYPLVNWEKPGKTIVVCVGAIFFVVIVHILCCCVCKIRYLIHKKIFVKKEKKLNTCKEHARMLSEQKDFTIPSVLDLK